MKEVIRRWIRKLFGFEEMFLQMQREFKEMIGDHTTIHADIHNRGKSMIIAIGQYKKRDYVKCYMIDTDGDFVDMVKYLKQKEKHSHVGRFDMPNGYPFSAIYPNKRF